MGKSRRIIGIYTYYGDIATVSNIVKLISHIVKPTLAGKHLDRPPSSRQVAKDTIKFPPGKLYEIFRLTT